MSALGHYIERAGVATTAISLVREQTAKVTTPRALWVPFALGRPLGSAADPEFQKDVMRAALGLIESATEPTIADYPHDAPDEAGPEQWACPLNLAPPAGEATLEQRLLGEIARLRPWALETRRSRGRTLFGASGAGPDMVDDVARMLVSVAESGEVHRMPESDHDWRFTMPLLIRHLADDLRTFYHEALAGQPGPGAPNHDALNDWIFGGTALGDLLQSVADRLTEAGDGMATLVRGLVIPEGHYRGGSAFPATREFGHDDDVDETVTLDSSSEGPR
ncbi:MAG: hypothetical protein AAF567_20650 [Actinomycetota bacterium]